ncbi:MAG TPA: chromate transporter [Burkholderiaceae bacterium]|jgi:chromate transporter|nr:chromate transporter [Burkholderiaceae bacterium]
MSLWWELFAHFLLLSLLSVGGAITVAPDMHRLLVEHFHLLNEAQFTSSIAIAQAAPGPNVLFVAVLGLQAAGIAGASATLLGIMLPSTTLALAAARWGHARADWLVIRSFKAGLAPITLALLVSTGWLLSAPAREWQSLLVTAVAALLVWRTQIHLMWLIAGGAVIGMLGWI